MTAAFGFIITLQSCVHYLLRLNFSCLLSPVMDMCIVLWPFLSHMWSNDITCLGVNEICPRTGSIARPLRRLSLQLPLNYVAPAAMNHAVPFDTYMYDIMTWHKYTVSLAPYHQASLKCAIISPCFSFCSSHQHSHPVQHQLPLWTLVSRQYTRLSTRPDSWSMQQQCGTCTPVKGRN